MTDGQVDLVCEALSDTLLNLTARPEFADVQ